MGVLPTAGKRASRKWGSNPIDWGESDLAASGAPSIETINKSGATARSWNRSTAKLIRPAVVLSLLCSASDGRMMAVEDMASALPSTAADAGSWPSARNPKTGLNFSRPNSGTITPAVARNRSNSL